jgi:hypothetical protein
MWRGLAFHFFIAPSYAHLFTVGFALLLTSGRILFEKDI